MNEPRSFSHLQLGVAAILGSPIAAALLSAMNIWNKRRKAAFAFIFLYLLMFGLAHTVIRTESKGVGFAVFVVFVVLAMGGNYFLGDRHESSARRSWAWVILVSVLSLVSYVSVFALTE